MDPDRCTDHVIAGDPGALQSAGCGHGDPAGVWHVGAGIRHTAYRGGHSYRPGEKAGKLSYHYDHWRHDSCSGAVWFY